MASVANHTHRLLASLSHKVTSDVVTFVGFIGAFWVPE